MSSAPVTIQIPNRSIMATTSKYELDFLEAFRQREEAEITVKELAGVIAHRLDELAKWARITGEEEDAKNIEVFWEAFDFIAGDTTATEDELDAALEQLYDWADNEVFDESGRQIQNMILCRVRSTSRD